MRNQIYQKEELNHLIETIRQQIQQKIRKNKFQVIELKETEVMIQSQNKQLASGSRQSCRSSDYTKLSEIRRRYTFLPIPQFSQQHNEKKQPILNIIKNKRKVKSQEVKGWTVDSATECNEQYLFIQ